MRELQKIVFLTTSPLFSLVFALVMITQNGYMPDGLLTGCDFLMKTTFTSKEQASKKWFLVDANGIVLGRLAATVAKVIRGKNKPNFTPHADTGDFVVVINADKVRLTGKKENQKTYMTFSRYVGGHKSETVANIRKRRPQLLVERAVKGMVPHTRLGRAQLRKLKVYAGSEHPHPSQQLESLEITT